MAFDIQGAKAAGYSDAEIAGQLAQDNNFDISAAKKSGYSDSEIVQHLSTEKQPAPKPYQEGHYSAKNMTGAAVEPMLAMGTGLAGSIAGGIAGLGTMAGNAMGMTNANPADMVNKVQNAMTYQPRTEGGQNALSVLSMPGQAIAGAANYAGQHVSDATGSPALGAGVNTAIQGIPLIAGAKSYSSSVAKGVADRSAILSDTLAKNKTIDATIAASAQNGYKFTPAVVPDSSFGMRTLQGIAGKAKTEQAATLENSGVTNSLAHDYVGLKTNEAFNPNMIQGLHDLHNIPYETVGAMPETVVGQTSSKSLATGNMVTKDIVKSGRQVLDELKSTREDATSAWQDSRNPNLNRTEARAKAVSLDAQAETLENQLDSMAKQSGDPQLVNALKLARIEKAKVYTIDKALNDSTGNVDAKSIMNQSDKNKSIDGSAKSIADMQRAFPELSKIPASGSRLDFSPLDYYGMSGIGGAAALATGDVSGLLAGAAMPLIRYGAKKYLMSGKGQSALLNNRYAPYTPGVSDASNLITPMGMMQSDRNKK